MIAQREFRREFGIHRNRAVPSGHAIRIWVRNSEATGSTLKKKGGSVKCVERWLQTARVTQSGDAQNGVDSFNGVSHYRNVLGCTYCFYTTTFLLYNGYRVFPGGKVRPGRATDYSPPSSAEVLEE